MNLKNSNFELLNTIKENDSTISELKKKVFTYKEEIEWLKNLIGFSAKKKL